MRLTRYTDYAIRVLLHVGAHEDRRSSIAEMARIYGISKDHLMKVVQDLGAAGFLKNSRGRGGGVELARVAATIRIGDVVRHTEDGFELVDCGSCLVAPACTLPRILREATAAFLGVLDRYTLADLLESRVRMRDLFAGTKPLGAVIEQLADVACDGPAADASPR